MKKLISVFLILTMTLALGVSALAVSNPDGHAGSTTVDGVPGDVNLGVYITAVGERWRYSDNVTDGSGDIEGPGFTVHADDIPEGAVRLVVAPIDDPEALAWFSGCAGESWEDTGVFYAVFYEDAEGNRMPAYGVQITVRVPGGYENVNVYSVTEGGSASSLDYTGGVGSVSFTTNGSLYYGAVHKHGVMDEQTDVGPGAPDTALDMTPEELAQAVLTDEDRAYMDQGVDVHIVLTVDDITDTVSPAEVAAVESIAGRFVAGEYIDVELLKQVGDQPWTHIHQTSLPIRVAVTLPERLLGHEEYAMAQVHDGAASFLRDLDGDAATVTFETSQFSTFAILYYDAHPAVSPAPTARPGEVPPTGDDTPLACWALLLAGCAAGLAVALAYGKKKDRSLP